MIEEQQNEKWSLSLISGALDRHEQRKIKDKALISLTKIWMDYFFERNPENYNDKDHFFDFGELFAKKFLNELAKQEDVFKRNDIIDRRLSHSSVNFNPIFIALS